jgi:homoserine kinase type II
MSQYRVLNIQDIKSIIGNYSDTSITSFEILNGGEENTNYLVATPVDKYVLTIIENKSKNTALVLAQLLEYLNNNGIRTSNIVRTVDNELITVWQGKPIILKEFIEGEIIKDLSNDLLVLIGEEMGKLHKIDSPDYLPDSHNYGLGMLLEIDHYESDEGMQSWFNDMYLYISKYISEDLPKSVIHSDLFWNNIIVEPYGKDGAKPIAILDFEEAGYYYRVFDIGMAIVGLCSDNRKIDLSKVKSFLQGYQKEIQLEDIERKALKPFVVLAATVTACWRHKQFNYMYPTPAKKSFYKLMKDLADNTKSLPDNCLTELLLIC